MDPPRLPDELRKRLETAGLLDPFRSLPVDLQADFIAFIEGSEDDHLRDSRIEMIVNLIRRSLCFVLLCELADYGLMEPVMRIRDLAA